MKAIKLKEQEIIDEFEMFDDWIDKYNYLIELGKTIPGLSEEEKDDKLLIKGCQARVWLQPALTDGKVYFKADSDALITKGIVALLVKVLSGQPPQDIVDNELSFIEQIGLKEHLSPTRANGLLSMIKQMKLYALALMKTK